jgi:putative ABC transport system substrate-binding protein
MNRCRVVPDVSRVAVLANPRKPLHAGFIKETQPAASLQRVDLQLVSVEKATDFEEAFAAMTRARAHALIVLPDHFFLAHGKEIGNFAIRARLPAVSTQSEFAHAGGLFAYGVHYPELFRSAATYVHKILNGAAPADLPVQQATKFELVVNLNTAKALGLEVPPMLLARADEVIE